MPIYAGDWIDIILQSLGVTKSRYGWARKRLGIEKPCDCHNNQETANKAGASVKSSLERYGRLLLGAWRRHFPIRSK
jgi:hypothetical protein